MLPGGEIVRPKLSQKVDYEGELGILIGRRCHKMKDGESAKDYILGYTIVNDVTARDLQKTDGQWTRAKGFDTFCPFGPIVNTELDLGAASRCRPASTDNCARMATRGT